MTRAQQIAQLDGLIAGLERRWDECGCFHARGQADRFRIAMEDLIRGRSAEQVARMQEARGLTA